MKLQDLHEATSAETRQQFVNDLQLVAKTLLKDMVIPDGYRIRQFSVNAIAGSSNAVELEVHLVGDGWDDEDEKNLLLKLANSPRNEQLIRDALASREDRSAKGKRSIALAGGLSALASDADGVGRLYKSFSFRTSFRPTLADRSTASAYMKRLLGKPDAS